MAAPVSTTEPLMDWEYELLAAADTAEGDAAWRDGDYRRAIALWLSAARWSQYANAAEARLSVWFDAALGEQGVSL